MVTVHEAVNDLAWQRFRKSLKGLSTEDKVRWLREYYVASFDHVPVFKDCHVCVRVDNYIKALCRGGQLFPGESLQTMLDNHWHPLIKR